MNDPNTNPDVNGLYNRDGNAFTDALIENIEKGNYFLKINDTVMNEKNLDYLKTNVRNLGFGDSLVPELEVQLRKGAPEFTLAHKTEINKREIEATLHFRKSDTTDMYFFNKYDTRMKNEKDETMAQTFYLNNGWGVTLKEAYNLLNGRAVYKELSNKEGENYKAWYQLDFTSKDKAGNFERKPYYENYGYDLKEALSYFNVKEMRNGEEAKKLLRSLERGNVQSATIIGVDKNVKVFLEANPKYKSVTIYNEKMKLMNKEQRAELMIKPDAKEQKAEKTAKKELGQEDQAEKKPVKGRKVADVSNEENGLIKKKRSGENKKGLSV